jgi:HlyD family secretion protein
VNVARQSLALARQQLADTELLAPKSGVILNKSAEAGAYLVPGIPVVTLGDMDHPWLRAYVNETRIGQLQLGQIVTVTTDTFPNERFTGRISFIGSEAEFTPKTVQTFEERVKLMYRIKIDLENPNHRLKPGMPADAVIEQEE